MQVDLVILVSIHLLFFFPLLDTTLLGDINKLPLSHL